MKRVLIVGFGRIGEAFYRLAKSSRIGEYLEFIVCDPTQAIIAGRNIRDHLRTDIYEVDLNVALNGVDICVNTFPSYDRLEDGERLLRHCLEKGIHYIDVSEDVEWGKMIRRVSEGVKYTHTLVAPHCGLAPGFINTLGASLTHGMDRVISLDLRVGALPRHVAGAQRYICTWSPEGVANEYLKPAMVISCGTPLVIQAFRGPESMSYIPSTVIIGGIEFESFHTSGGCSTLITDVLEANQDGLQPRPTNISYQSIRYKGHHDWARKAITVHGPNNLVDLLKSLGDADCEDTVYIYVGVLGCVGTDTHGDENIVMRARAFRSDSASLPLRLKDMSAIQATTAGDILAVIELLHRGQINTGYLRHEHIDIDRYKSTDGYFFMGLNNA